MSKEKQIDEMARIIQERDDEAMYASIADSLYNAGYRKQSEGKWVYEYTGDWLEGTDASLDYKCTLCDQRATDPWNFCPHCGAKMKGGAE